MKKIFTLLIALMLTICFVSLSNATLQLNGYDINCAGYGGPETIGTGQGIDGAISWKFNNVIGANLPVNTWPVGLYPSPINTSIDGDYEGCVRILNYGQAITVGPTSVGGFFGIPGGTYNIYKYLESNGVVMHESIQSSFQVLAGVWYSIPTNTAMPLLDSSVYPVIHDIEPGYVVAGVATTLVRNLVVTGDTPMGVGLITSKTGLSYAALPKTATWIVPTNTSWATHTIRFYSANIYMNPRYEDWEVIVSPNPTGAYIYGNIIDENDNPVSGIVIGIAERDGDETVLATDTTDANGNYEISLDYSSSTQNHYQMVTTSAGWDVVDGFHVDNPLVFHPHFNDPGEYEYVEDGIVTEHWGRIYGELTSEASGHPPIEGALCEITVYGGETVLNSMTTLADGLFDITFSGISGENDYEIICIATGFDPEDYHWGIDRHQEYERNLDMREE